MVFAIVVNVVTENVSELLYVDDLVLTSKTMNGLREKFWKWKKACKSKGLKVNLGKTKVVVIGAEGEVSVNKKDPWGIRGKLVMANSMLYVKYGKWIKGRCAKVKRVTSKLGRDFGCERCKKQGDELVELEELFKEVETVKCFCYLGDRVNASGGYQTAVTATTSYCFEFMFPKLTLVYLKHLSISSNYLATVLSISYISQTSAQNLFKSMAVSDPKSSLCCI